MSVYATWFHLSHDEEHGAPWWYENSGAFASEVRVGSVDLASPGQSWEVTDGPRWARLSVDEGPPLGHEPAATVLLMEPQVRAMRDAMTAWLDR